MPDRQRVALVTGASSGIGAAIASRLAQAGFRVFGASRRASAQPGVESVILDVTDEASVEAGVGAVLHAAGRIDLLVNNAGFALVAALEDSSLAQAQAIFDTNFFGVLRMTRAVLPGMRIRRAGRIVNLSSIAGFLPMPFAGLYGATKHALEGYTESLDLELRPYGIRAVLIEPGFVRSAIGEAMPKPDAPLPDYARGRENMERVFAEGIGGGDPPELVAQAVLAAATAANPKPRYTTGRQAAVLAALRRVLPAALFQQGLRRQFKLE